MAVARVDSLSKTYGDVIALDDISFEVMEGEVFALVGPNGAGKTTLIRCLTGTTQPDAGTLQLLNSNPTRVDKNRIGLLPQDFSPPERLFADELVRYYAGLYDDSKEPASVLSQVGLEPPFDTWYENLSGGQKRRVCVAIALVNDPDVLFLDEPTTGIDPSGRQQLWSVLEEITALGSTIVLTTHYMEEAERLADRVGILANGRMLQIGSPSDLIEEYGGSSQLLVKGVSQSPSINELDYQYHRTDEGLMFKNISPTEISSIVESLQGQGVQIDELVWQEPDLEDVYLELTDTDRTTLAREEA
ncbi:MAG: ABC transporter ATP-binding protein [Halobacteriaceae archaeon]